MEQNGDREHWDVPYLTIDPTDIGREYREVIRVNSQSGKGGVAYLLESEFGIELPKEMQREFGPIANEEVDRLGREVSGAELKAMFWKEYIERDQPWSSKHFETESATAWCAAAHVVPRWPAGRLFTARETARWPRWFTALHKRAGRALKSRTTTNTR